MAATWTSTIVITNLAAKRIRVTATRTDGEDVRTYSCDTRIDPGDVQASKLALAESIRDQYLADVADQVAHAALLGTWEADLNTWLEGQEA
ncbi:MAG TPA: hypothetical protein VM487_15025 [Phycisphaerae bacterium]|nr:hypothetical protein [Phycisphaerae bacterium]